MYLEALGLESVDQLPEGLGTPPPDDPQIFSGHVDIFLQSLISQVCQEYNRYVDSPHSSPQPPVLDHLLPTSSSRRRRHCRSNPQAATAHHARPLDPLPGRDLLLTSAHLSGIHVYPAQLLRLYLEHETHLWELVSWGKNFDFAEHPIPAGIDTFVAIWNEDTHSLYGFSSVDPNSGAIILTTRPPPPAELLYPTLLREEKLEDRFKLSREERQLLERLKADAAMRESGRIEKSHRQYEGREARRKSKAHLGAHSSAMRKVASALATTLDLQNQAGLDLGFEAGSPSNAGSPGGTSASLNSSTSRTSRPKPLTRAGRTRPWNSTPTLPRATRTLPKHGRPAPAPARSSRRAYVAPASCATTLLSFRT
ncbi:hypothetical protein DICSQDRAFT_175585 [Dichomitus squalens LYAD-421 SS1]|uniref:Uncharacterized protein n=1 Tax=Dichomitus squalens (strain LYAD-421) TaxID=732165 RepID=R7SIR8_DICSQ|nr:uncharacterized protein DICSQDRAFT_175585 [Dichomitus squalens LYAD-421 SS1]EJF55738.1 hypothetical protein DICSQDRAFT_175585 [Dichomitus squalens LYAD-421 SS1]